MRARDEERVAIYARVSSEQQSTAGTIASQIEALEKKVREDGFDLEAELRFVDDGYSGATLLRPALERIRDHAAAGNLDRLYVHSPDRLARNYAYQVVLLEELERAGVEVVFLDHRPGKTPEEKLLLQVQGMVSEYERAKILERSRRGKLHAARRGSVSILTQAPYGYRFWREGGGPATLQVAVPEAHVVRRVYQWIAKERVTIAEVVRRLETQGIPSPCGQRTWSRRTLWGMLRNPAYKGTAAYGKTRCGEGRGRLRPRRNSPEHSRRPYTVHRIPAQDWILIPVPALVSEELFACVQEQLSENRRVALQHRRGASSLLQGLVVCKQCGYALVGRRTVHANASGTKTSHEYYRCLGSDAARFGGVKRCNARGVRRDLLDEAVWEDVSHLFEDPARVEEEFRRRVDAKEEEGRNSLESSRGLIRKLERSIQRLIDAYTDGVLEKAEFEPRLAELRRRLEGAQRELEELQDQEANRRELKLVLTKIEDFAGKVRGGLRTADWAKRRELIRLVVKRIEVEGSAIRIVYRVDPRADDQPPGGEFLQPCLWRAYPYPCPSIEFEATPGIRRE